MKTDPFQSCGHCWVSQICWYIECSTFTASSFRIWNSSVGIPSPALALFVEMLPKAQLTSHSSMAGSRWVTTASWLSGSRIWLPMQKRQETQVWLLDWEDPLEEEMATHSSVIVWKTPWTEKPGGLQSMGSQRVGQDWACTRVWYPVVQYQRLSVKQTLVLPRPKSCCKG